MTVAADPKLRTFPLIEAFGPTVQGEGPLAGLPTFFLRFGLCGFRCAWCDSMYAVDPVLVKQHARQLTAVELLNELEGLRLGGRDEPWVTLSGGNPAIHELGALVAALHAHSWRIAIETQGDVWRDWLSLLDMLVVSPKPPSSGMVSEKHDAMYERFHEHVRNECLYSKVGVKIVVFDEDDYVWARDQLNKWRDVAHAGLFMSVGTDSPHGVTPKEQTDNARADIADRMLWLYERLANDVYAPGIRALPQLHVIAWGHARGV